MADFGDFWRVVVALLAIAAPLLLAGWLLGRPARRHDPAGPPGPRGRSDTPGPPASPPDGAGSGRANIGP